MKEKIIKMLEEKGSGRSFVELEQIEGFAGDLGFGEADNNLVYWEGMSSEAIEALNSLREEELIEIVSTHPYTYLADGKMLNLPLAKEFDKKYKQPHWQPCGINKGPKFVDR